MNNAQESFKLIRKLAAQKGVSINKMLSDCGLGKSLVADSERNNSFPTADKLATIAFYLGVTTDYLLTGKETNLKILKNEKENEEMERLIDFKTVQLGLKAFFIERYYSNSLHEQGAKKLSSLSVKSGISIEKLRGFLNIAFMIPNEFDKEFAFANCPTSLDFDKMMFLDKCDHPDAITLKDKLNEEFNIFEKEMKSNAIVSNSFIQSSAGNN